jgi:hypothetical protein
MPLQGILNFFEYDFYKALPPMGPGGSWHARILPNSILLFEFLIHRCLYMLPQYPQSSHHMIFYRITRELQFLRNFFVGIAFFAA